MDEMNRKKAEEEYLKNLEERKHHEKINYPGHREQLEEVWKEQDHLEPESFDYRTFFKLHGILHLNGILKRFKNYIDSCLFFKIWMVMIT